MRKNSASEKIKKEKKSDLPKTNSFIPFLTGRPRRDSAIDTDDIMNLQIAIFTCKSFDEFLKNI